MRQTIVPFLALAVVLGGGAHAHTNSAARLAAFAQLPDWTGIWEMGRAGPGQVFQPPKGGKLTGGPGRDLNLPYKPAWEARYEARQKEYAALPDTLTPPDPTITVCSWGFPRMELGPANFEITVTPEETMIVFDPSEIRHIYTDGRPHPTNLTPSPQGHSIGHWEGQTLVADTVGLDPTLWLTASGAQLSPKADITERWSMQDQDHISDQITIVDPIAFTKPLTFTRKFRRVKDTKHQIMQNCFENDREQMKNGYIETIYSDPNQGSSQ